MLHILFHLLMIVLTHGLWLLIMGVLYLVRHKRYIAVPVQQFPHRRYW